MKQWIKYSFLFAAAVSMNACNIDFDGIGKDDEGNDITLVLLDLPACDVNYTFTAVDETTGALLNQTFTAEITPDTAECGGLTNANQILVTDAMKVSLQHNFTGELELALNPNITVSESNPVGFTIVANSSNPDYIGVPEYVRSTEKGKREVSLGVLYVGTSIVGGDLSAGMLMRSVAPKSIGDVSLSGISVQTLGSLNRPTGNGYVVERVCEAASSGTLTATSSASLEDYGIMLPSDKYGSLRRSVNISEGQRFFVVKKYPSMMLGKIAFDVNSPVQASASFAYSVVTAAGTFNGIVRNTVPFTRQYIEQIIVPSSNKSATLTIIPLADFQLVGSSTREIADVTVPGGGIASPAYTLEKQASLTQYKIKLYATCETDRKVSLAPTKSFIYKKKNTNTWLRGEMKQGYAHLLMEKDADYDFGIYFDGKFYSYPFTTSIANIEEVLTNQYVKKYSIIPEGNAYYINVLVAAPEICDILQK